MGDLSIFVLSCDSNFRDYICNYLLMDGHYVDSTDEIDSVKGMLQSMRYDLIILNLPEFNENLGILSEEEIHKICPDTKVLFLMNGEDGIIDNLLLSKNIDNCLIKSFILDDLPSVLDKLLKEKLVKERMSARSVKKTKGFKERRKAFRIKIDLPIKYTFISPLGNIPSEENITKIVDISQNGVMFRVDSKSKFLDVVYLNILLPTCTIPINTVGEIIWEKSKYMDPWRYIGVRFSNLNQADKKNLESFIIATDG